MAFCGFRKVASNEPLKNCVCRKVSLPPGRSKRGRSSLRRIFTGNAIQICGEEGLYSTTEAGLFYNISLINHTCVPNTTQTWVMDDFKRQQVRAVMDIEKDEEIVISGEE